MKRSICFLFCAAMLIGADRAPAQTPAEADTPPSIFNVKSFGAKGDGSTDDFASITAAMAAAAENNATVFFPPGQYIISQTLRPSGSITLKGAGWRSAFIKGAALFNDTGDANNGNALIGISGPATMVQIRNLGFIANGPYLRGVKMLSTSDNLIEKCWFAADFEWACFIGGQSRSNRINNIVSEGTTAAHNVEINDSSFNEVSNSHLIGAKYHNIEIYLRTPGECVGNRIINNHLERAKGCGLAVMGDQSTVVSGNVFESADINGFHAISAQDIPSDDPSVGGTLSANTFLNNGGTNENGVSLLKGTKAWNVKGNTIRGSGNCGIYVGGTAHSVEGNSVTHNRRHGIYIQTDGHIITNNICLENSMLGTGIGDGIRIEGANACILSGNRCSDPRVPKMQAFGIGLIGGGSHIVTGNNIAGNQSLPIFDISSESTKANNITQ